MIQHLFGYNLKYMYNQSPRIKILLVLTTYVKGYSICRPNKFEHKESLLKFKFQIEQDIPYIQC